MRANDKAMFIQELRKAGYSVGLCGDGWNDLSAVHLADVGITVGKNVLPAAFQIQDLSAVPKIIKAGDQVVRNMRAAVLFVMLRHARFQVEYWAMKVAKSEYRIKKLIII